MQLFNHSAHKHSAGRWPINFEKHHDSSAEQAGRLASVPGADICCGSTDLHQPAQILQQVFTCQAELRTAHDPAGLASALQAAGVQHQPYPIFVASTIFCQDSCLVRYIGMQSCESGVAIRRPATPGHQAMSSQT